MDHKGPESLGEILSRLFTARGWGRRQDRLRLEKPGPRHGRLRPGAGPNARSAPCAAASWK